MSVFIVNRTDSGETATAGSEEGLGSSAKVERLLIQRDIIIQILVRVGVLVMALDSCLVTWVFFMK